MNDERLLQEISASVNLASLSERIGEPMDLRLRLYSLAIAYSDAQVAETIDGWKITREHLQDQISAKDAEIKRLRDGIQKAIDDREKSVRIWSLNEFLPVLKGILSPAPVTEGTKKTFSLQMYECNRCEWYGQVGESIETESYDVCPKCLSEDLTLLDSPKNEDQHE